MDCYTERAHLLALISAQNPRLCYVDPEGEDGFNHVIAIEIDGRWLCWHIADLDMPLFNHVQIVAPEGIYDGHSTPEKYSHIRESLRHAGGHVGTKPTSSPFRPEPA